MVGSKIIEYPFYMREGASLYPTSSLALFLTHILTNRPSVTPVAAGLPMPEAGICKSLRWISGGFKLRIIS